MVKYLHLQRSGYWCGFLVTMLPKSNDVKEVILGQWSCSIFEKFFGDWDDTIYPSVTNNIFEKLKSKIFILLTLQWVKPRDAASGDLLIIAGGEKKNISHARPVLKFG